MLFRSAVGLLMAPGFAGAQEYGFNPGDWELTLSGSGTSDNELDNTTLSAEAGIGYFFSSLMEAGVRQGIAYSDIEGGSDDWNASTRGFLDLHFALGKIQPFIGVNLGYLYGDTINETWIAGPEGGLKAFITDTAFIQALIEYNFTFDDADEVDDAFDDGRFVYALGIGVRW